MLPTFKPYHPDLCLLKTAGYPGGKLFLGKAVPGQPAALGSVHVRQTKAASVPGGLRPRRGQEPRQARADSEAQQTTGPFLGCSCLGRGAGGDVGTENGMQTVARVGFGSRFAGLCRYLPSAFKGEHPKQRTWQCCCYLVQNESCRTRLHFFRCSHRSCCCLCLPLLPAARCAALSPAEPPPTFPHPILFLCARQIFISWTLGVQNSLGYYSFMQVRLNWLQSRVEVCICFHKKAQSWDSPGDYLRGVFQRSTISRKAWRQVSCLLCYPRPRGH